MSKIKKVFIIIGVILLLLVVIQIVNAAKYKMVVNVVEGENVLGVNPTTEQLDFGDLSRNNGMTRYVNLQNNGNTSIYVVVLRMGEINDLIKLSENYFTLNPGEEVRLGFQLHIPPSAEIRKYSGWTIIFRLPKLW
jgi:hypothetical protein